jgi:hypothetical protein
MRCGGKRSGCVNLRRTGVALRAAEASRRVAASFIIFFILIFFFIFRRDLRDRSGAAPARPSDLVH